MKPNPTNRREFLRGCLRGGGLLAIGGVASLLASRSARGNCAETHPCGACPMFSACDLPKAKDSKKTDPISSHGR